MAKMMKMMNIMMILKWLKKAREGMMDMEMMVIMNRCLFSLRYIHVDISDSKYKRLVLSR